MHMQNDAFRKSVPFSRERTIEAKAYHDFGGTQVRPCDVGDGWVILYEYPDNRSLFQRVRAWWHLRQYSAAPAQSVAVMPQSVEPDWPGHWATLKYL